MSTTEAQPSRQTLGKHGKTPEAAAARQRRKASDIEKRGLTFPNPDQAVTRSPAGAGANKPVLNNPLWVSPAVAGILDSNVYSIPSPPGDTEEGVGTPDSLLDYEPSDEPSGEPENPDAPASDPPPTDGNSPDPSHGEGEEDTPDCFNPDVDSDDGSTDPEAPAPPVPLNADPATLLVKVLPHVSGMASKKKKGKMDNPFEPGFASALQSVLAGSMRLQPDDSISLLFSNCISGQSTKVPVYKLTTSNTEALAPFMKLRWDGRPDHLYYHMLFQGYDIQLDWVFNSSGIRCYFEKVIIQGIPDNTKTVEDYKDILVKHGMRPEFILEVSESEIDESKKLTSGVKQLKRWINFYINDNLACAFGPDDANPDGSGAPTKRISIPPVAVFLEHNGKSYLKPVIIQGACRFCLGPKHPQGFICPYSTHCRACLTPRKLFREGGHACGAGIMNRPAEAPQVYSVDLGKVSLLSEQESALVQTQDQILAETARRFQEEAAAEHAKPSKKRKKPQEGKNKTKPTAHRGNRPRDF